MLQTYFYEFEKIIKDIVNTEIVNQMKLYRHHYKTTCFKHSKHVALYTYILCKKWNLDYVSGTRAAMLHDFFLYDWRVKSDVSPKLHGFRHPKIALKNAEMFFELNNIEKDCIVKHMWPLTFFLPKYKESYAVTIADKISTFVESRLYLRNRYRVKKVYRYAYLFLSLLIIRIF